MTWSIVAHDPETGAFAVAVSTCNFAVGASCPFVRSGVGAVSTQSFTNRYLAPAILDGLERGLHPADAIQGALAGDRGAGIRQVHAVDRLGRSAAWTGANCVEWCGDSPQPGLLRRRQHAGRPGGGGGYRRRLRRRGRPAAAGAPDGGDGGRARPPAATSAASNRRRCC